MSDQTWINEEEKFHQKLNDIEIPYKPCMTVTVTVVQGRKISLGCLHDLFDTPDTKVYLRCETATGKTKFKTKTVWNSHNPIWQETFTFVFSTSEAANSVINVDIYEEDKFKCDSHFGVGRLKLSQLIVGEPKQVTLDWGSNGKVDFSLLKQWRNSPDFRLSLGLSIEERQYRIKRKPKTMKAIQNFLGVELGPASLKETPTVAVAIAGGGYRAVATACGAMEAISEMGLLGSIMYIAGLSGSAWYVSSSFLHGSMNNLQNLIEHHDWLREQMEESLTLRLFDISFYKRCRKYREFKLEHYQPTTLVDYYGIALGETFLGIENSSTQFSSLRKHLETADVPFPILSCAHVRNRLPMSEFWDEVEMTPYEVSFPSYGINIPTEQFNSRWGNGILQQSLPEPPLHYMMAASGSAFAIMWSKKSDRTETREDIREYINNLQESHHERIEFSEFDESSDEDNDDEIESVSVTSKAMKNFASPDDKWIEILQRRAFARKKSDRKRESQFDRIGRGLILDRTARIKNCAADFRGLQKYRLNTDLIVPSQNITASERILRKISTKKSSISLCDSALGCNLPSIHALRPQRRVDVLIVVDCGNYLNENELSIELFATVQAQAHDHGIKFPRISMEKIAEDPFRECYLFEDEEDTECPVVLWFTLANKKFKTQNSPHRRPGYPTPDDVDSGKEIFNDFCIFPENSEFGTLRLHFSSLNFDRLRELMRFNILENDKVLREKIASKVGQLKQRDKITSST
ncbi:cytosolic phospholipase A2-like [Styela clava]